MGSRLPGLKLPQALPRWSGGGISLPGDSQLVTVVRDCWEAMSQCPYREALVGFHGGFPHITGVENIRSIGEDRDLQSHYYERDPWSQIQRP